MYLLDTVKLLNDKCTNALKYSDPKKQSEEGAELHTWDIDDIDYDFAECRKYCLFTEAWDVRPDDYWLCDVWPNDYVLCDSCKKILRQRIEIPFKKSKSELLYDIILLQNKMQNVLERLSKLEDKPNTLRNPYF